MIIQLIQGGLGLVKSSLNNMTVPQSENSKEELLKSNTSMQHGEYPELRLQTTTDYLENLFNLVPVHTIFLNI